MKIKTADLKGVALDWAVAQCEGTRFLLDEHEGVVISTLIGWISYRPSTAWVHGGPIIERERIELKFGDSIRRDWIADFSWHIDEIPDCDEQRGSTPLVAAMRCYVASKLGDEIDVPEELL